MPAWSLTADKTLAKFASYAVGRYYLGYEYLAMYWASVLFERIINRKFSRMLKDNFRANGLTVSVRQKMGALRNDIHNRRFQYESYINYINEIINSNDAKEKEELIQEFVKDNINLNDKIDFLDDNELVNDSIFIHREQVFKNYIIRASNTAPIHKKDDVRKRLHNFRILRNKIMHASTIIITDDMPCNKDEYIYYIWSELDNRNFKSILEKWNSQGAKKTKTILQMLFMTTADYMVRAVDETMNDEIFSGYEAIIPSDFEDMFTLRDKMAQLKSEIEKWFCSEKLPYITDILTTIDTTSAYIWMPLVSDEYRNRGDRNGIFNCSVSILATPLDFRIYMDFGGYAKAERAQYYQFLQSDEYKTFMSTFDGVGEMQVFDIDWFSFIHEKKSLNEWEKEALSSIKMANDKLKTASEPITWNRMLHGYVFEKKSISTLEIDFIKRHLMYIIDLHHVFCKFNLKNDTK